MKTFFKILCVLSILAFVGGLKNGAVSGIALLFVIIFGLLGWGKSSKETDTSNKN